MEHLIASCKVRVLRYHLCQLSLRSKSTPVNTSTSSNTRSYTAVVRSSDSSATTKPLPSHMSHAIENHAFLELKIMLEQIANDVLETQHQVSTLCDALSIVEKKQNETSFV